MKDTAHWSQEQEAVKSIRPLKVACMLVKYMPFPVMTLIVFPVSFFYFVCSRRARENIRVYQEQLSVFTGKNCRSRFRAFLQIYSFSLCVVEKIAAWSGKMSLRNIQFRDDDVTELKQQLAEGKGAFLIGSHLGNMELLRYLATYNQTGVQRDIPVTAVMDTNVTSQFSRTLQELDPKSSLNLLSASDIGIGTVDALQENCMNGGLVVLAADRTSAAAPERTVSALFLGRKAPFPYGCFLLALLVGAPVYHVFSLRRKTVMFSPRYTMIVKKSQVPFPASYAEKKTYVERLCREFAGLLQDYCLEDTCQWYNFYDFWMEHRKA